jgi:hypothetical protein
LRDPLPYFSSAAKKKQAQTQHTTVIVLHQLTMAPQYNIHPPVQNTPVIALHQLTMARPNRKSAGGSNPFFATQNSLMGMQVGAQSNQNFSAPPVKNFGPQQTGAKKGSDMSFMFQTEARNVVSRTLLLLFVHVFFGLLDSAQLNGQRWVERKAKMMVAAKEASVCHQGREEYITEGRRKG